LFINFIYIKANKVKKPQVIIPSRPSNPRKRKFSNDSKMIERSKRSSTVKVNSEIRSSPHDFTSKKIDVIFNGNQYLEPTFANLSLSNDDVILLNFFFFFFKYIIYIIILTFFFFPFSL